MIMNRIRPGTQRWRGLGSYLEFPEGSPLVMGGRRLPQTGSAAEDEYAQRRNALIAHLASAHRSPGFLLIAPHLPLAPSA